MDRNRFIERKLMPDFTMCTGTNRKLFELSIAIGITEAVDCPLRNRCIRYLAEPKFPGQSFFLGIPYNSVTKSCEYFGEKDETQE